MAVYVRVVTGDEDVFEAHRVSDGYYDRNDHYVWPGVYNPSVRETNDGALEVMYDGKMLGKYPPGSWISWRSD